MASSDNTADQQHRSAAYKSGRNFSNVGSTDSSKYNAGNGGNGAGSDAYSWCHEKAGWQKTAGYSGATISSDLMLCENAQRMSLVVALGVAGGGGRSRASNVFGELSRASAPVGRLGSPMEMLSKSNTATEINGISYTGHVLDRMQGRGLVPSVVEDVIKTGHTSIGKEGAIIFKSTQARVVMGSDGNVITVNPYSP